MDRRLIFLHQTNFLYEIVSGQAGNREVVPEKKIGERNAKIRKNFLDKTVDSRSQ